MYTGRLPTKPANEYPWPVVHKGLPITEAMAMTDTTKATDNTTPTTSADATTGTTAAPVTSTDTPEVAPAPLGDNSGTASSPSTAGTGAPNAVTTTSTEATEKVIAEALGDKPTEEQTARVRQVLGDAGVTPTPETVNGVSVVGKKLSDDGKSWVDDPDYEGATGRGQDVFDRIGIASPNEGVRQVLEEIARFVGMTSENTLKLPEGMPSIKSTASLRKDVGAVAPISAPAGGASQTPASTTSPVNSADSSSSTDTSSATTSTTADKS